MLHETSKSLDNEIIIKHFISPLPNLLEDQIVMHFSQTSTNCTDTVVCWQYFDKTTSQNTSNIRTNKLFLKIHQKYINKYVQQ